MIRAIVYGVAIKGLAGTVNLKQRHEQNKEESHVNIWRSKCKGPEVGVWLVGLDNRKEDEVTGVLEMRADFGQGAGQPHKAFSGCPGAGLAMGKR